MRRKAIADLVQLTDDHFFATVSEGLGYIAENAERLISDANRVQEAQGVQGVRILEAIAEEEASKYLVLLDAIRCPREPAARLVRQLKRFNDHLAKGVYVQCCSYRPGTLGELVDWIERDCRNYYLDGPNDVDWIFDNEILRQQEQGMYVDYVENEGEHSWWPPTFMPPIFPVGKYNTIVRLVQGLSAAGFNSPGALRVVAELWRAVEIREDFAWADLRRLNHRTLQILDERSLLVDQPEDVYRVIADDWLFPLYPVKIEIIPVDKNSLVDIRERHYQRLWY